MRMRIRLLGAATSKLVCSVSHMKYNSLLYDKLDHHISQCSAKKFLQSSLRTAGLDQQLLDILSDESRYNRALDSFAQSTNTNESWSLSIDSQIEKKLSQVLTNKEKEEWSIKAVGLICFVFPRKLRWKSPSNSGATIPWYAHLVLYMCQLYCLLLQSV
jgi:hypothetical protein